jgi:hypothetical protein
MKIVIEHGESRAFDPLERERFRVLLKDASLSDLLEAFAERRETNLRAVDELDLTPADLNRRGRHPTLGTVTLGQLLATWTVHDLNHIAQIVRVMAGRFRADVGPWKGMLRLLRQ